jgi:hypothetical protein
VKLLRYLVAGTAFLERGVNVLAVLDHLVGEPRFRVGEINQANSASVLRRHRDVVFI